MNITKKRLEWMIEYRGGMGNRIDAYDIRDFINDEGYLYKAYKKRHKTKHKAKLKMFKLKVKPKQNSE